MIRLSISPDMITATVVSAASNMQSGLPLEIGGVLATISLILFLSMTELLSDSDWWDKWVSSTLSMGTAPFIVVFLGVVISKMLVVL